MTVTMTGSYDCATRLRFPWLLLTQCQLGAELLTCQREWLAGVFMTLSMISVSQSVTIVVRRQVSIKLNSWTFFFFKCKSLKVLCGQPVILLCVNILFPGQNKQWLSKHVISCMGLIWVYCVSVWMVKNKNTLNWASLYKKRSQGKSFSSLKVEFICDDTALAWGNPVTGSVWVIQNKGTGLLCIGDYIEIVPHECNMCCLSFSFDSHTEANCKGSAALCWLLV